MDYSRLTAGAVCIGLLAVLLSQNKTNGTKPIYTPSILTGKVLYDRYYPTDNMYYFVLETGYETKKIYVTDNIEKVDKEINKGDAVMIAVYDSTENEIEINSNKIKQVNGKEPFFQE